MKYILIAVLFASCSKCYECTHTQNGAVFNVQQVCDVSRDDIKAVERTRVNAAGDVIETKCR